ncbi:MAG: nucleotidyltransferase domain-containing protein [Pseudomonadota bacterium]
MIDVRPEHLAEIRRILALHAPDCEVRAFGSRVNGRPEPSSDLDLVLMGPEKFDWRFIERLKDAFAASDLPFMVDVIDWHDMSEEFRNLVEKKYEVVS